RQSPARTETLGTLDGRPAGREHRPAHALRISLVSAFGRLRAGYDRHQYRHHPYNPDGVRRVGTDRDGPEDQPAEAQPHDTRPERRDRRAGRGHLPGRVISAMARRPGRTGAVLARVDRDSLMDRNEAGRLD